MTMASFGNTEMIRREAMRQKSALWNEFERIRAPLTEIARAVYPPAVDGLMRRVEDLHSPMMYEGGEDEYRLTYAPMRAFRIGCSGFYVNFMSPARRWYRFVAKPRNFASGATDERTAPWIDSLTEASRYMIYHSGSYPALNTAIRHLIAFGFACVLSRPETEDEQRRRGRYIVTECLRVGTYALGVDSYGKPDRVLRHFAFTAEQLAEQFGRNALPETVLNDLRRGSDRRHEVWCLIEPHRRGFREDARAFRLSYGAFAYRAVYWLTSSEGKNNGVLAVRGYARKPFVAPRLEVEAGDVYGRGRCMDILGDIRGLQTACEDDLDISGQNAQPAVVASEQLKTPGVHLGRGGVNYVAPGEQRANAIYRALQDPPSAEGTRATMGRLEQEIKDAFFNNEFASINSDDQNNPVRTATEIEYRKRQSMEQLSGAATALDEEFLLPLIEMMRDYTVLVGLYAIPNGMSLSMLDIKYESNVHRAQNAPDVNSRTESLSFAAQVAQMQVQAGVSDTVMDNFRMDDIVRNHHRALGAPEHDLVSPETVKGVRAGRAEAAQAQAQIAQEGAAAQIAKDQAAAAKAAAEARAASGGMFEQAMAGM